MLMCHVWGLLPATDGPDIPGAKGGFTGAARAAWVYTHCRPYIGWAGECEERFEEVKKKLLKRFGTTIGAEFLRLSWGTPEAKNAVT